MNVIKITVNKMAISCVESLTLASGSQRYIECQFTFDEDWTDHIKTAIFTINRTEMHQASIIDNACMLPVAVSEHTGQVNIGVVGVNGDQVITTVYKPLMINQGALSSVTPGDNVQVVYKSNTDDESTEMYEYGSGDIITIKGKIFTNEPPLELVYWSTTRDDTGIVYPLGIDTQITESLELFAVWKEPVSGSDDHRDLTDESRYAPDQHLIRSIFGLESALDNIMSHTIPVTDKMSVDQYGQWNIEIPEYKNLNFDRLKGRVFVLIPSISSNSKQVLATINSASVSYRIVPNRQSITTEVPQLPVVNSIQANNPTLFMISASSVGNAKLVMMQITTPLGGSEVSSPWNIDVGGTGAVSEIDARNNLDVYSKGEIDDIVNTTDGKVEGAITQAKTAQQTATAAQGTALTANSNVEALHAYNTLRSNISIRVYSSDNFNVIEDQVVLSRNVAKTQGKLTGYILGESPQTGQIELQIPDSSFDLLKPAVDALYYNIGTVFYRNENKLQIVSLHGMHYKTGYFVLFMNNLSPGESFYAVLNGNPIYARNFVPVTPSTFS